MSEQSRKYSHTAGIKNDHDHRVRISVPTTSERVTKWNETCARAIELFGLPGDKYTCRFTKEAIEFWFLAEKDALVFELCCG